MGLRITPLKRSMQGSAIVMALGLMSLVVILVTSMMLALRTDMHRVNKMQAMNDLHAQIRGSEAMALTFVQQAPEGDKALTTFEWWAGETLMYCELQALSDKKAPFGISDGSEDTLKVLHIRIKGKKLTNIYTVLQQEDEIWRVVYRTYGVWR